MKKKVTILLFSMLIVLVSVIPLNVVSSNPPEIWVHSAPDSETVQLSSWIENETTFMTVTITFYSCCWKIENWSSLVVNNNDFTVDSEVWVWLGYCCQVIWDAEQIFELGQLDEGVYSFSYLSWGYPVKSMFFEVGFPADINDDGKIDMKDVSRVTIHYGEEV